MNGVEVHPLKALDNMLKRQLQSPGFLFPILSYINKIYLINYTTYHRIVNT